MAKEIKFTDDELKSVSDLQVKCVFPISQFTGFPKPLFSRAMFTVSQTQS